MDQEEDERQKPRERRRPSRAAERHEWTQLALVELEELAELYGLDPAAVRLP
ncbi:hypothetical protein [Streptomyces buecherae]|uniref:hypothetical protein n=1 Tax=Streptomyces buecherae TaxID=2763006 RepID=UPI0037B1CF27